LAHDRRRSGRRSQLPVGVGDLTLGRGGGTASRPDRHLALVLPGRVRVDGDLHSPARRQRLGVVARLGRVGRSRGVVGRGVPDELRIARAPGVARGAGFRADGALASAAADAWWSGAVGFISGAATRPALRIARGACAFVTASLLDEHPVAALIAAYWDSSAISVYRDRSLWQMTSAGPLGSRSRASQPPELAKLSEASLTAQMRRATQPRWRRWPRPEPADSHRGRPRPTRTRPADLRQHRGAQVRSRRRHDGGGRGGL
jgi:hypothetical protein